MNEEYLNSEIRLRGTPYLIGDDKGSQKRLEKIWHRSRAIHDQAEWIGREIRGDTQKVFSDFGLIVRSELVAESNRIEDYDWTTDQVRQAVLANKELLNLPVHAFMESLRADPRLYEALGLFKAQDLADEWATDIDRPRPRQHEVRQLHAVITAGHAYAGRYKIADNSISGAKHQPPSPAEAAEGMRLLCDWWQDGTGDPILDATVAHAWLVHLHPFDDGNGRMARLLANMLLSRSGYPPLIVTADTDRGEYYDCLAVSDEGDILPLYDLFTRILRRTTRTMSNPGYVEQVINTQVLNTPDARYSTWRTLVEKFEYLLHGSLEERGWQGRLQGYPDSSGFHQLASLNRDGNSWFLKGFDAAEESQWLLWWGFNSDDYRANHEADIRYPSIFLSLRDFSPEAHHPYRPLFEETASFEAPDEAVLTPGRPRPVALRYADGWRQLSLQEGADAWARHLCEVTNR
ncbi:hypothetical protein GCM10027586_02360 [Kineococcus gypseus]|uniref:Fic family protein n=1 Tax=Kineococcus gypseus TaxID=1637102 RepID=UPI003D7C718E